MRRTFRQGTLHHLGRGKIHVGDPQGQDIFPAKVIRPPIVFETVCPVSRNNAVKFIAHHNLFVGRKFWGAVG
jgi:hypothetical protein